MLYYSCMPMEANITDHESMIAKGWTLTTCPKCKRGCYYKPELEKIGKAVCTDCALRAGVKFAQERGKPLEMQIHRND